MKNLNGTLRSAALLFSVFALSFGQKAFGEPSRHSNVLDDDGEQIGELLVDDEGNGYIVTTEAADEVKDAIESKKPIVELGFGVLAGLVSEDSQLVKDDMGNFVPAGSTVANSLDTDIDSFLLQYAFKLALRPIRISVRGVDLRNLSAFGEVDYAPFGGSRGPLPARDPDEQGNYVYNTPAQTRPSTNGLSLTYGLDYDVLVIPKLRAQLRAGVFRTNRKIEHQVPDEDNPGGEYRTFKTDVHEEGVSMGVEFLEGPLRDTPLDDITVRRTKDGSWYLVTGWNADLF